MYCLEWHILYYLTKDIRPEELSILKDRCEGARDHQAAEANAVWYNYQGVDSTIINKWGTADTT